jgi:hypothetical protein
MQKLIGKGDDMNYIQNNAYLTTQQMYARTGSPKHVVI